MDDKSLDDLLKDEREKQFWLKPVGSPRDHPDWDKEETRTRSESQFIIHCARNPARVAVGAILLAFRVPYSKLIYVAERLSSAG